MMKLLGVKADNITDYKKTALLIAFPHCTLKCGEECQNKHLMNMKDYISATPQDITTFYSGLITHKAIVMAGLEPLDSFPDVLDLVRNIMLLRKEADIVIYTGYTLEEYKAQFEAELIKAYKNSDAPLTYRGNKQLIVKVGRYDSSKRHDWCPRALGVNLATTNQCVLVYNPDGTGYIEKYVEKENKDT